MLTQLGWSPATEILLHTALNMWVQLSSTSVATHLMTTHERRVDNPNQLEAWLLIDITKLN